MQWFPYVQSFRCRLSKLERPFCAVGRGGLVMTYCGRTFVVSVSTTIKWWAERKPRRFEDRIGSKVGAMTKFVESFGVFVYWPSDSDVSSSNMCTRVLSHPVISNLPSRNTRATSSCGRFVARAASFAKTSAASSAKGLPPSLPRSDAL